MTDDRHLPNEAHIRELVSDHVDATDLVDTEEVIASTKRDPLVAPYRRIRSRSEMYPDLGGSVSADVIGCGFACNQCWSTYGLAGKDSMKWMHADEAADKLIQVVRRTGHKIVRISNGEPFLYPEHLLAVAERVLDADLPSLPIFQIETNGLHATPEWIDKLDDLAAEFPDELGHCPGAHSRIGIWWSMKVATPAIWVWHTGRSLEDFEKMQSNWQHAMIHAVFLSISTALFDELIEHEGSPNELEMVKKTAAELSEGENKVYLERFKTYFPYEREIDRRMGARRLRAFTELAADATDVLDPSEYHSAHPFSPEYIMGNGLFPPFPRPRRTK